MRVVGCQRCGMEWEGEMAPPVGTRCTNCGRPMVLLQGEGTTHRENADELKRRIREDAGLADPVPRVSVDIGRLLVDLYVELMACVLELELNAAVRRGGSS
jgi:hypothetical protein